VPLVDLVGMGQQQAWARSVLQEDMSGEAKYLGLVMSLRHMSAGDVVGVPLYVSDLARETGVSKRSVKRALNELERTGHLIRRRRAHRLRPAVYHGSLPEPLRVVGESAPQEWDASAGS
jgi:hypothetical protein